MIDTVNRTLLLVLGLLLIASGVGVLLTATGNAGALGLTPIRSLGDLYGDAAAAAADAPVWWQSGLLVSAIVITLIGVRLLLAELRPPRRWRREELDLTAAGTGGSTTVRTRSISRAVAEDLTTLRQVSEASVTTSHPDTKLEVDVRLSLVSGVDFDDLDPALDAVLLRLQQAVAGTDVAARVRIDFDDVDAPRVG